MCNGEQVDRLLDYSDVIDWLKEAGLIDSVQMKRVLDKWVNAPQGKLVAEKAQEFRAVMRHCAESSILGRPVPAYAIEEINAYLQLATVHPKLQKMQDGNYRIQTCRELNDPLQLIAPIAESAAHLFATGDLFHIKKCENPNCVLFFCDISKNHSRRWCSMESCGNRMKAAAHYRRNHGNL